MSERPVEAAQLPCAGWMLRLSGSPALLRPDGGASLLDRHGALLAARIVLDGPQPRNLLAAWLWPDLPPARARANLRQRLLRLRQQAGIDWLQGARVVALAPGLAVLPWQQRAAGDLLAGVEATGEPDLADWLAAQRRALVVQRAGRCRSDWQAAIDTGRWQDALDAAAAWRVLEPMAEAPALALARVHHRRGDAAAAVAVLQDLAGTLQTEFGLSPGSEASALLALLRRAIAPDANGRSALPPPVPDALWRPPVLVGGASDLTVLAAAWSPHQAAWIAGEAGCGCSRLLQHRARHLGPQEAVYLAAEPGDAAVPGRLLQRLAAAMGVAAVSPARPAPQPGWVIDALHWADDDSLAQLPALLSAWAVPVALGSRPLSADVRLARLAEALSEQRRVVLHVPTRWSSADITQLLREVAWPEDAEAGSADLLAPRLCRHTGGHPGHVLDTLRALHAARSAPPAGTSGSVDTGTQPSPAPASGNARQHPDVRPTPVPLPLPAASLQELAARLQRLAPAALGLLRLLVVAGPEADAAQLAAVLQCSLPVLADAWQALADAGLLGADGQPHDLALAAARASLPAPVAAALHRVLAAQAEQGLRAVQDDQPPAATAAAPSASGPIDDRSAAAIADHWLAGGAPARALPWLLRAADAAHVALRTADEANHLGRAVDLLAADDPAGAVDLLLRLVRVAVEAHGIGAAAAPLARALHLATDGAMRARVLLLASESELNALRPAPSAQAAEQALAVAPPASPLAAEAVLRLHKAWCLAGRAADAQALWQHHAGWLHDGLLPDAEAVSDRGWVLDRLGAVREARVWHQRALERARREGRPVDVAVVLGNLAQSLVMSGEPVAAEAVLDQLEDHTRRHAGLHSASDYSRVTLATAVAMRGDVARALDLFDAALADAALQSASAQAAIRVRRAGLWAAIGQTARALADADAALRVDSVPDWTRLRARWLQTWLAPRGSNARRMSALASLLEGADAPQRALFGALRLLLAWQQVQDGPGTAAQALSDARASLRVAVVAGHAGLRWTAHWVAAAAAQAAGRHQAARRHLRACLARPPGETASDVPEGLWWHGLWRVAQAAGDLAAADSAWRAGRGWVLAQQARLPEPFRASFIAAVPGHRALLAAAARAG